MTDEELRGLLEANATEMRQRFDLLQNQFGGLQNQFGGLQNQFGGLRDEFGGLRGELGGLRGEFRDLRRHFDIVAESFDTKVDFLVEGLMNLDEKMGREIGSVREEMRQGFADTHDLIKFSYNLARRKR
jgi:archaellum component FlaC